MQLACFLLHAAASNDAGKAIMWQPGNCQHQGCEMAESKSAHRQVLLLAYNVTQVDITKCIHPET